MAQSKVPNDPNLTPEMRRFLDDLARNQTFRNLVADALTVGELTAESATVDGADVLTVAGEQTIEGGFDNEPYDHGTVTTGTVTIDPRNGQKQKLTNNGAFTIEPATGENYGDVSLHIINAASAGAVTFSDWTKKYPSETLTTTDEDEFNVVMHFLGSSGADYAIFRRQ